MYPVVERWLASPLSKNEFCQQEGLSISVLGYWITRYNRERMETQINQGFIPLRIATSPHHGPAYMEVFLSTGIRISFNQRPSEQELLLILTKC
jgi:hypothetical protein